eukprot:gb/GECG01012249.1/.p1 GENE.gb/GECG01012249.1/~~gb/GECG01012249.1/.p1  ORF type:complete len:1294 (+),score=122.86 gb/GECG01012249.1/:1-3882(+)
MTTPLHTEEKMEKTGQTSERGLVAPEDSFDANDGYFGHSSNQQTHASQSHPALHAPVSSATQEHDGEQRKKRSKNEIPWDAIDAMQAGTFLLKCGRLGNPHFRKFSLSPDCQYLSWYTAQKGEDSRRVKLTEYALLIGQHTEVFQKQKRPDLADLSLSLVQRIDVGESTVEERNRLKSSQQPNRLFDGSAKQGDAKTSKISGWISSKRSLDIVCKDKEEFSLWRRGLTYLTQKAPPIKLLIQRLESNVSSNFPDSGIGGGSRGILVQNFEPFSGSGIAAPLERRFEDLTTVGYGRTLVEEGGNVDIVDFATIEDITNDHSSVVLTNRQQKPTGTALTAKKLREIASDPEKSKEAAVTAPPADEIESFLQKRITRSCNTFVFGSNAWGQAGTQRAERFLPSPTVIGSLIGKGVRQVACGLNFTIAATEMGELYTWGSGSNGRLGVGDVRYSISPVKINFNKDKNHRPTKVAFVAAGHCHSLAISDYGKAYVWGDNAFGQLGTGDMCDRYFPTLVTEALRERISRQDESVVSLNNIEKIDIARQGTKEHARHQTHHTSSATTEGKVPVFVYGSCGMSTSVLVDLHGRVYTCGLSSTGALGHPSLPDERRTRKASREEMANRSSFDTHNESDSLPSLPSDLPPDVDDDTDNILDRELEIDPAAYVPPPDSAFNTDYILLRFTMVEPLKDHVVVRCSSGDFHSAVITRDGLLYTWGANNCGQLGLGDFRDSWKPRLVSHLCLNARMLDVVSVSCGAAHTIAIVRCWCDVPYREGRKRACHHFSYAWGACTYGQLGNVSPVYESDYVHYGRPEPSRRLGQLLHEETWKLSHLVDNSSTVSSGLIKPHQLTSHFILELRRKVIEENQRLLRGLPCTNIPIPVMHSLEYESEEWSSTGSCQIDCGEGGDFFINVRYDVGWTPDNVISFFLPVPSLNTMLEAYGISTKEPFRNGSFSNETLQQHIRQVIANFKPMEGVISTSAGASHSSWILNRGAQTRIFVAGVGDDGQLGTSLGPCGAYQGVSLDKNAARESMGFSDLIDPPKVPSVAQKHSMALGERLRTPAQKYFFELTLSDYAAPQISVMRRILPISKAVSNDDFGVMLVNQAHARLKTLSKRRQSLSALPVSVLSSHECMQNCLDVFSKDPVPLEAIREGRRLWWLTMDDLPYLKDFLSESQSSDTPLPTTQKTFAGVQNVSLYDTIGSGALPLQGMSDRYTRAISCGGFHSVALVAAEWIKDSNASHCLRCNSKFTFRVRKHHCRSCGGVFCHNCCSVKMPLLHLGHIEHVRVCDGCYDRLKEA